MKTLPNHKKNWPIGTRVIVTKDDGSKLFTKTSSAPWMLGGHTPVILVEGISGCHLLDRVNENK